MLIIRSTVSAGICSAVYWNFSSQQAGAGIMSPEGLFRSLCGIKNAVGKRQIIDLSGFTELASTRAS